MRLPLEYMGFYEVASQVFTFQADQWSVLKSVPKKAKLFKSMLNQTEQGWLASKYSD